jgi:DNA-binding transcriptional ArsR family regulator
MTPRTAEAVAEWFRVLSEPTRLRLLDVLRDGERCVGDLAQELGCSQANVSKHLSLLADAGLVSRRRDGLRCWCAVADDEVFELVDAASGGLRRHLERRAGDLG